MYVPQDCRDMIALMRKGTIATRGIITHYFKLGDLQKVFDMIDSRTTPFFKIMLTYD
jgi:threonine dehydrogenase-like Zn-dependent dehydrogenase